MSGTNTGDQDLSAYALTSVSDGKYLLNTTDTLDGSLTVTDNVITNGPSKLYFNPSANARYTPKTNNQWHSATPFGKEWHDTQAFDRNYTTTQYTSTDGTTFSSTTLETGLFAQQDKIKYDVIASGVRAVRFEFQGVAYNTGRYFQIISTFVSPAPVCSVLIETSADGITWSTIHTSTGVTFSSASRYYWCDGAIGDGGDNYVRVTIDKGDAGTGLVKLSSLRMLTQRAGDQGQGREDEFPYTWDKNKNISIQGNLTATGAVLGSNLSGTNTGDQDLSGYLLNTTDTLTGDLTVTGNVNLSNTSALAIGESYLYRTNASTMGLFGNLSTTGSATFASSVSATDGLFSGNVTLQDNGKAKFGTSGDLEIYHDGSNSKIVDSGTGDLRIAGNVVRIRNSADTENMISAVENGAVSLAYDNGTKLATTSTGVDVTGNLTATGDVSANKLSITEGEVKGNSGNLEITSLSTGIIYNSTNGFHTFQKAGVQQFQINGSNGAATFASSVSATDGLFSGDVGIGVTPTSKLHLSEAGGVTIKLGTSNNTSQIEAREVGAGQSLILSASNNIDHLTINDTGAATFASSVSATELNIEDNGGIFRINTSTSTYPRIEIGSNTGTTACVINRTTASQTIKFGESSDSGGYEFRGGDTTFASSVSATDGLFSNSIVLKKEDPILLIQDTSTGTAGANATLRLGESGAGGALDVYWDIKQASDVLNTHLEINHSTAGNALTIASTLAATFASSVTANGGAIVKGTTNDTSANAIVVRSLDGTALFSVRNDGRSDFSGPAIFTSSVTANGVVLTGAESNASTTVKGIIELATQAEVNAGTDTSRAITPSRLKSTLGITATLSTTLTYSEVIGDGAATSIVVTHGIGNQFIQASAYEVKNDLGAAQLPLKVECEIELTSATTTTFKFNVAPALDALRVVITG